MRKDIRILIAFALVMVCPPFTWAQSLSSTSLPKSSRIDLKGLTRKADSGSTESQFQLGLAYQYGQGVDKDIYEAIRWYRMVANSGGDNLVHAGAARDLL